MLQTVSTLDVDATLRSLKARAMRRRECRLAYLESDAHTPNKSALLGNDNNNEYSSAYAGAKAVEGGGTGASTWSPTETPCMRVELVRFLVNYCVETPNAPPTVYKTVAVVDTSAQEAGADDTAPGDTSETGAATTGKGKEGSSSTKMASRASFRAYQRAVQWAQLPAHLRRSHSAPAPFDVADIPAFVGSTGGPAFAYDSALEQLSQMHMEEFSTHGGSLFEHPLVFRRARQLQKQSVMAKVNRMEEALARRAHIVGGEEEEHIGDPGDPRSSRRMCVSKSSHSSSAVVHTSTTVARSVRTVSGRQLRSRTSSRASVPSAGTDTGTDNFNPSLSISPESKRAYKKAAASVAAADKRTRCKEGYGVADGNRASARFKHVHNGSHYLHPEKRSRIQRQFFLESSVSREILARNQEEQQRQRQMRRSSFASRDSLQGVGGRDLSPFEPSKARDGNAWADDRDATEYVGDSMNSRELVDSVHRGDMLPSLHSPSFHERLRTFDQFDHFEAVEGAAVGSASPGVTEAGVGEEEEERWVVHLSNFQLMDLHDASDMEQTQHPCITFSWGYYTTTNTTTSSVADKEEPTGGSSGSTDEDERAGMVWVPLGSYETKVMHGAGTQCLFPSSENFSIVLDSDPHEVLQLDGHGSGGESVLSYRLEDGSDSSSSGSLISEDETVTSSDSERNAASDSDISADGSMTFDVGMPITTASRPNIYKNNPGALKIAASEALGGHISAELEKDPDSPEAAKLASVTQYELRVHVFHRDVDGGRRTISESRMSLEDHIPSASRYYHFDLDLMRLRPNAVWPNILGRQVRVCLRLYVFVFVFVSLSLSLSLSLLLSLALTSSSYTRTRTYIHAHTGHCWPHGLHRAHGSQ